MNDKDSNWDVEKMEDRSRAVEAPIFHFKTRRWLATGTIIQALLTLAGALCALYAHQSGVATSRTVSANGTTGGLSWTDPLGFLALGFLSMSMGLQGVMATRLATPLGNCVVLTSVWVSPAF